MSWIEFLEALARVAEKASLKRIGKEDEVRKIEAIYPSFLGNEL